MMTKAEWEKHKRKPIWVDSNSMAEWGRPVCTLVDALFEYRERTKGMCRPSTTEMVGPPEYAADVAKELHLS